jgi:ribose 5-phosphate isomerase A
MKPSDKTDSEKNIAAEKALDYIQNGMIIGLGSGSTFKIFLEKLSKRIKEGLKIQTVSTSSGTTSIAESLGIQLTDLPKINSIDITVDGADEVDHELNGVKGGGGALLYEKIIASISRKNIWMINSEKYVDRLGKFPLPVEVVPFGADHTFKKLEEMGLNPKFRMNPDQYFITDGKHFIIDLDTSQNENIKKLDEELKSIPGIIETGLFLNLCSMVIIGKEDKYEVIEKS